MISVQFSVDFLPLCHALKDLLIDDGLSMALEYLNIEEKNHITKKGTLKINRTNFMGFSTKFLPDQCGSPDSAVSLEPKNRTKGGSPVEVKKTLGAADSITKSIEQLREAKDDLEAWFSTEGLHNWKFIPMVYPELIEPALDCKGCQKHIMEGLV